MRRRLLGALSEGGLLVRHFEYSVRRESLNHIKQRLRDECRQVADAGAYIVVGYSFGGVLARAVLCEADAVPAKPVHLVLLASPIKATRLCQAFRHWWVYRWLTGECGQLVASAPAMAGVGLPELATTCVYGTWRWFGPLTLMGGCDVHDGMVTVEEAAPGLCGASLAVKSSHALIPDKRAVHELIARCATALRPIA